METNIHENIGVVLSLPENYHMVSHVIRCPNFSKKSATDVVEAALLSLHQSRRSCVKIFLAKQVQKCRFLNTNQLFRLQYTAH